MRTLLIVTLLMTAVAADAMTVRTTADRRHWQTVYDRSAPLEWRWAEGADAAALTFRAVRSTSDDGEIVVTQYGETRIVNVLRLPADSLRGCCEMAMVPSLPSDADALYEVTLAQTGGGVTLESMTTLLAFPLGVGTGNGTGSATAQPITVRTDTSREWWRVNVPRVSGFDAAWWGVEGPSGYEVLWRHPVDWYCVERSFVGAGVVDEATLRVGSTGFVILLR